MTAPRPSNPIIPIPENPDPVSQIPSEKAATSAEDPVTGLVTAPINPISTLPLPPPPPSAILPISSLDPKSPRKYPKAEPDPSSHLNFSSPMMVSVTSFATSLGLLGTAVAVTREWHKYLLPYYSFDQFVHKVDKVASSKRVKNCVRDLRERVARGGDPTKLHESPDEFNGPSDGQVAGHSEEQTHAHYEVDHVDDIQDSMLNEIYQKVSEEPSHEIPTPMVSAEELAASGSRPEQMPNNEANCSTEVHITEEQRARMEANKLKALERAASASSDQITEEQRARMEANRLKALERAAARARSLQSA
ncbi:hypothetical protein ERO13_A03G110900v2 [Gossypium hirsutum]|nr:hypothetical protein ERO13_A03G110900v2 [Gossypium hirsutum]